MLRHHRKRDSAQQLQVPTAAMDDAPSSEDEHLPLSSTWKPETFSTTRNNTPATAQTMSNLLRKQPVWLLLAIASGACAAFNGVFAKL